jgi:hypothetical protein
MFWRRNKQRHQFMFFIGIVLFLLHPLFVASDASASAVDQPIEYPHQWAVTANKGDEENQLNSLLTSGGFRLKRRLEFHSEVYFILEEPGQYIEQRSTDSRLVKRWIRERSMDESEAVLLEHKVPFMERQERRYRSKRTWNDPLISEQWFLVRPLSYNAYMIE